MINFLSRRVQDPCQEQKASRTPILIVLDHSLYSQKIPDSFGDRGQHRDQ